MAELAATLSELRAEMGAQRQLLSALAERVGSLTALVAARGGVGPGEPAGGGAAGLPLHAPHVPPAPRPPRGGSPAPPPSRDTSPRGGSGSGGGAFGGGGDSPPAGPTTSTENAGPGGASDRPTSAALAVGNTAALLPEYYLREQNGTIAARIGDVDGAPLSVRVTRPAGAAPTEPLRSVEGLLLRVHLERANGTVRRHTARCCATRHARATRARTPPTCVCARTGVAPTSERLSRSCVFARARARTTLVPRAPRGPASPALTHAPRPPRRPRARRWPARRTGRRCWRVRKRTCAAASRRSRSCASRTAPTTW
jgi:hypothetical protein